jgi:murein DD-endopeptidase MepM/ murein hydrolase activator NlpD
MDFSANTGTPVYATGNGTVTMANRQSGYGLTIEIDHGFDYKTLYAHLSKILVKRGQKVERGEIIGLVGSTGKSTGPHLHYEVIHRDSLALDPVSHFFASVDPEEYVNMLIMSSMTGQSMD